MHARGLDPVRVARFLDRVVFCLLAEDVGLLPENLFARIVDKSNREPARFGRLMTQLFEAMAEGGDFGLDAIDRFNGDLFADGDVLELTPEEIDSVRAATRLDWSEVDPSIFGTLFERGMDPAKRSQLGAHYTSREDIERVVDPVVLRPLRREWEDVRRRVDDLLTKRKVVARGAGTKALKEAEGLIGQFLERLANVRVLDPACGSGNFLYVDLQKLKDLEKEVGVYADAHALGSFLPRVGPWQLYGIETNAYAFDLAQTTVWIGWLQWTRANGHRIGRDPILESLRGFERKDAILDLSDPEQPGEPDWPHVDFIVGNPPFLGGKKMRAELGDDYVDALFGTWRERVRPEADLCCYWYEKARRHIEDGKCSRAGLLATQGIRGGASRDVLKRIKETGDIFFAESDREWILDGATVHVSMVGFDDGSEQTKTLDGSPAETITAQLTTGATLHTARTLAENLGIAFMGITPAGKFDLDFEAGKGLLDSVNPNGLPTSDVLRPYLNGKDLNQRSRCQWTIDFGIDCKLESAALYESAFGHLVAHVKPVRQKNNREAYRLKWWLYAEPRPAMRSAFAQLDRYVGTCMVAKHRVFVWIPTVYLPANVVIVFASNDDYFFGVLHSRLHILWASAQGTQLREKESGDRYTPTTCFETFPFPQPTEE
jgi:type II restriction/modification system DNA methylase subunit YeeA